MLLASISTWIFLEFGENALSEAEYPKNALVVTTTPPELSSKWLDKMGIQDYMLFDKVTPEPYIDDVTSIISVFKTKNPSVLIGLGGGSIFVFKGKYRAVLIQYPNEEEKDLILTK